MLLFPLMAVGSLIALSQSVDPMTSAACKALSAFSLLGCLSLAAAGGRRSYVELGEMGELPQERQGREAA